MVLLVINIGMCEGCEKEFTIAMVLLVINIGMCEECVRGVRKSLP